MNKKLITDAKQFVNYIMIPLEDMYYHHYEHALSVMERSVYLASMEGCGSEKIEMLAIAALFHDTGFVIQYDDNEQFGAKIARNYLRTILYPDDKITIIENIILATIPSRKPSNILEEIIKDADMDNLGREDFFDIGEKLKQERETIKNIKIKDPDWKHASLSIIEGHTYFTSTQIQERNENLKKNAEKLKKQLSSES